MWVIRQEEDYLCHYGVKGMKWRKRRARGNWREQRELAIQERNKPGMMEKTLKSVATLAGDKYQPIAQPVAEKIGKKLDEKDTFNKIAEKKDTKQAKIMKQLANKFENLMKVNQAKIEENTVYYTVTVKDKNGNPKKITGSYVASL